MNVAANIKTHLFAKLFIGKNNFETKGNKNVDPIKNMSFEQY